MSAGSGRPGFRRQAALVAATVATTLALAGLAAWRLGWLHPPGPGPAGGTGGEREVLFYRNPMNPAITSAVPARDEMGMDYIPVYADERRGPAKALSPEEEAEAFFADGPAAAGGGVPGLARVTLDGRALELAGVQTVAARRGTLRREVRTVGRVVPDETRVRHVHTKVGGWVERLVVNFSGQLVERGSPLLELYSPELLATQEEYLQALAAPGEAAALAAAARRRLELFDVPAALIDAVAREGRPRRAVALRAPVTGFVTGKGIFEGQRVEPGTELYTVTDLGRVWVEADLYEHEVQAARVGAQARLTFPHSPGLELEGAVTYVYPQLDAQTRTLKVRLEFANPDLALRPEMYGDVAFTLESLDAVSVPDTALIESGTRQVVFVSLGGGVFEPRQVRTGARGGGAVQVLSGVAEGEPVVVKANFLLDSESRLQAIIQGGPPGAGER